MNMQKFFEDNKYAASWGIMGILILSLFGSIYLATKTIVEIKGSANQPYYNSINIMGEGEVLAVPDIAKFNFVINEVSETVDSAQQMATIKTNQSIDYLKSAGIEEKDIKTVLYNVNPKYEWIQEKNCFNSFCPGNSVIVGYEVFQSIDVKVRDVEKAGEILTGIGQIGISNVGGLEFIIDDEDVLLAEAKKLAIEDAKNKIQEIAKALGIKVGKIVSYYEESPVDMMYGYGMGGREMMTEDKSVVATPPQLPTGENKIYSRVSVSFEIK
jgi:uncharacterized protein YggE